MASADPLDTVSWMELPYDALEVLQTNGITLIDLVREHDHATPLPALPGWTLGDLAHHQGEVWDFWSRVVADRITDLDAIRAMDHPPRLHGDLLVDWLSTAHHGMYSALVAARIDDRVWTWTGADRDVTWVRRRMAQETAVHLWDVADALRYPYGLTTAVAADGIDEFIEFFLGRARASGAPDVEGTVHLHCTDTTDADTAGGEWYVAEVSDGGRTFTREHRKGDAAARGQADDLLLWLWRRRDVGDGTIEIIGDGDVALRFRGFTDLD